MSWLSPFPPCPVLLFGQGFTSMSSHVEAEQVCSLLHELFASFDYFCEQLGVLKWATVGGELLFPLSLRAGKGVNEEDSGYLGVSFCGPGS